jgi:hypothetical protein
MCQHSRLAFRDALYLALHYIGFGGVVTLHIWVALLGLDVCLLLG